MDPIMFDGLLMIVAIFVTPALLVGLVFMSLELRDTRREANYFCDQWKWTEDRLCEALEAEHVAWSDGYSAGCGWAEKLVDDA